MSRTHGADKLAEIIMYWTPLCIIVGAAALVFGAVWAVNAIYG